MPCKHITNDIIVPDGCQYVHSFWARNVPFHLFDGGGTPLRTETKGQLCSEGPLECGGRCEACIASSYCIKYGTCELPPQTLRQCKNPLTDLEHYVGERKLFFARSLLFGQVRGGLIVPSCSAGGVGNQGMGSGASPFRKYWLSGGRSSTQSSDKQLPLRGEASRGGEAAAVGVRTRPGGQRWCATS